MVGAQFEDNKYKTNVQNRNYRQSYTNVTNNKIITQVKKQLKEKNTIYKYKYK